MGCSSRGPRVLGSTRFLFASLENGLPRWVSPSFGVNRVLIGKLGDGYSVVDIMGCLVWHFRLCSFQGRDTELKRFLAKNQLYSNEITKF